MFAPPPGSIASLPARNVKATPPRTDASPPALFPGAAPVSPRKAGPPAPGASPAMRRYLELKREAGDAILFFRLGDFYEMFYEDAVTAADRLDLALTSRQKDARGTPIPMAGVPHHAAESHIARLVRAGFRVAVCEQVEAAGPARGLIRREIARIVTPSTYLDPDYLAGSESAYLMAVTETPVSGGQSVLGAAWVDISTGDFAAAEFRSEHRRRECAEAASTYRPRELLHPEGRTPESLVSKGGAGEALPTARPDFWFETEHARDALLRHFGTASIESFGIAGAPGAIAAAGAALTYLGETQRARLGHITRLKRLDTSRHLVLDAATQRHLELFQPLAPDSGGAPLIRVLDETRTGMGARLLRRRIAHPLLDLAEIEARLEAVGEIAATPELRSPLADALSGCPDLERLASRVSLRVAGPREYLRIAEALDRAHRLAAALAPCRSRLLRSLRSETGTLPEVRARITATIAEDAPVLARDAGVIRPGVSPDLDELRELRRDGRRLIAEMESRERERTGIPSLRIRFNQVFGYTIEVSRAYGSKVPDEYVRRQTLVNAERYVTEELKDFETRVANAEEGIARIEARLFRELEDEVGSHGPALLRTAGAIAAADVALGLGEVAVGRDYVKPEMHDGFDMKIEAGRHPVVEAVSDDAFVPNDLDLSDDRFLMILTGPNMGGKSTFLRQAALHQIMAQAGSFVPAAAARIPVADRVFARVGATDDLSRGRSTFLSEMEETAQILHHATRRSLVLLDEVGRGTATWDGLSLAWALVEHVAGNRSLRMKTLFATHYHELTRLADRTPGVVNRHVEAREHEDRIVFLRRVLPGGTDRSYGIQVARLAGVPKEVIARAKRVLADLTSETANGPATAPAREETGAESVEGPERPPDVLRDALRELDPDRMSPRDALDALYELKKRLDDGPATGASGGGR